jgi:hypothetical protein
MGCDGGSIPKRAEMVKTRLQKPSAEQLEDSELLKTRWTCCFLSAEPLERPIVACGLGRLYNKDSVVKHLLERKSLASLEEADALGHERSIPHITSVKHVFQVKLDTQKKDPEGFFVCPVTGRPMNGHGRVLVVRTCGCVFAEQAWRELEAEKKAQLLCLVCSKPCNASDLIPLYSTRREELDQLRSHLNRLHEQLPKDRKSKLKDADRKPATNPDANDDKARRLFEEIKRDTTPMEIFKRTKVTEELYLKK